MAGGDPAGIGKGKVMRHVVAAVVAGFVGAGGVASGMEVAVAGFFAVVAVVAVEEVASAPEVVVA